MNVRPHAWAGILGPTLFTATYLAQEAARRGEYDAKSETISALEAGPAGWVQQVNFVVLGLLTIVFAVGLHRAMARTRAGFVGPFLMGVSGAANLVAAIRPLREDATGQTYDPGGHLVGGIVFFLSAALSLIFLSRRMARDPRWRGLAAYTLIAGVAALGSFVLNGILVVPDAAPLHDWAGVAQRVVILLVIFPCRIAIAVRLGELASTPRSVLEASRLT